MMNTAPNNTTTAPGPLAGHLAGFARHYRILKGLQESSVGAYCADIREFFAWRVGNADGPLDEIAHQDVEEYLYWCYRQGNQSAALATKLVALRNFSRYLVYAGVIPSDFTAGVPRTVVEKNRKIPFNRDEVLRMFAACNISTVMGMRDVSVLILAAFAGFRVSEIVKFNVDHISDDGGDVDLIIQKTKRGASRTVYLWKAPGLFIRQVLASRLAQSAHTGDPLLVSHKKNGQPRGNRRLTSAAVNRIVKRLAVRAGILKAAVSIHAFRATHACDLQRIHGYIPQAIMERLGIKNLSTLEHYLVRRERIHRTYRSLHEYWIEFPKCWSTKEEPNARLGGEDVGEK